MTEAIEAHGGTLVAYQGDGIVAAFGAPLELPDHADRAVEAVRDMAGPRLDALNAWLRARDFPPLRIGIGVDSGVVMSGNVGCKYRLEYTVVGDAANTASRLEAMTKDYPHQVLISGHTRSMLLRGDPADLEYVGHAQIRGKTEEETLWTLQAPTAAAHGDKAANGRISTGSARLPSS
jgi:adenylate cyclase